MSAGSVSQLIDLVSAASLRFFLLVSAGECGYQLSPSQNYKVFHAKIDKKKRHIWPCGCCRNFYDIFVVSKIAPIFGPVFGLTEF